MSITRKKNCTPCQLTDAELPHVQLLWSKLIEIQWGTEFLERIYLLTCLEFGLYKTIVRESNRKSNFSVVLTLAEVCVSTTADVTTFIPP